VVVLRLFSGLLVLVSFLFYGCLFFVWCLLDSCLGLLSGCLLVAKCVISGFSCFVCFCLRVVWYMIDSCLVVCW